MDKIQTDAIENEIGQMNLTEKRQLLAIIQCFIESDLDESDDEKASDSKPHVYHRCGCIEMMKKGRVLPRMAALPVS